MVKGIAVDLAPRGITVNTSSRGRRSPTWRQATSIGNAGDPAEARRRSRTRLPVSSPYLASGESGYMTGSSLTIDGGMAL